MPAVLVNCRRTTLDNAARKLVDEQYSTVILTEIRWLRYGVNGDDSRDGRTVYDLPFFQRTRQVSPGCWPRYRHSHLHHPHQPHLRHHHLIIVIIFSPFPFGRICLVVLVMRKAGKSKWSLAFRLYIGSFPCAQLPGPVHTAQLGRVFLCI